MEILLIPGLWLDASSWRDVMPALERAGHDVHPLTMPGVGEPASSSRGIGMADWVEAVVDAIDALTGPVVLVGHSGGGNVAWSAADARPERIARVVLVDTIPPAPGRGISEFPVVDGVVPFPGWDAFPDEDVHDIDAATRERTAAAMLSVPAHVPTDPVVLDDARRFDIPVTLLMGALDEAELRAQVSEWGPYGDEFSAIAHTEVVRIGSAHWPQFTQPARLAQLILAAIR